MKTYKMKYKKIDAHTTLSLDLLLCDLENEVKVIYVSWNARSLKVTYNECQTDCFLKHANYLPQ